MRRLLFVPSSLPLHKILLGHLPPMMQIAISKAQVGAMDKTNIVLQVLLILNIVIFYLHFFI